MKACFRLLTALLLLSFYVDAAGKPGRAYQLAANIPDSVRWAPVKPRHSYHEQLPDGNKIAQLEKLGYGSATLLKKHDIVLKNDKTVEETVTNSRLYINANGIENAGNSGFWIDTTGQRVEIQEAYVLQSDGRLVDVDPGAIQINSDNTAKTFNDFSYVTVPFAQLTPGSIAVLVYKIVTLHDKLPLPWSRALYPINFEHVDRFQVRVDWSDASQKPSWSSDYAKLDCREGPLSLSCATTEASSPIPADNQMPPVYDVLPALILAEPTGWATISNNMQKLTDTALSNGRKIRELAERLTKNATSSEEKLGLLSTFVARDIRYIGIEHGHGGVVPRPTLTTLERGYGDCKDKAMLFVDLARQAGLDAYPVLASSKRYSLAKLMLPASHYFDHMLACVKLSARKESCVDLTDPETSPEHLSASLQGAVSLTIGRGTDAPRNLAAEAYTWVSDVKADNRFTDEGAIVETLERRYNTHWASGLRHALASKSQADRDRWLLDDYRSVMSDKVTPVVRLQGLEQPESNVVLTSTTEFRNAFNPTELMTYTELDPWLRDLARDSKSGNSHYPYAFQGIAYKSQMTYRLNSGKHIANLGPQLDYESAWGSFHRHYKKDDGSITAYTELKMPRAEVPVEKLAEFNRFLDLSGYETRIWFNLQPK